MSSLRPTVTNSMYVAKTLVLCVIFSVLSSLACYYGQILVSSSYFACHIYIAVTVQCPAVQVVWANQCELELFWLCHQLLEEPEGTWGSCVENIILLMKHDTC